MNQRRGQLLGLLSVLAGIILVIGTIPSHPFIDRFGYIVVVLLSVIALLIGGVYAFDRRFIDANTWEPRDTEPGYRVAVPGDDIAQLREQQLKERLRNRTISSLVDHHDCSRSEAETHLENGTWTDDRLAAAYISPSAIRVPLTTQLIGLLRKEPRKERAVRRTVVAIRDLREGQ